MEMLHLVWEHGPATVAEIHERIRASRAVAYTTVMSQLRKLADKGYLSIEKKGTAFVYSTARAPGEVRSSLLSNIVEKVFRGSAADLVANLVASEQLSDDELDEIKRLVQVATRDRRSDADGDADADADGDAVAEADPHE